MTPITKHQKIVAKRMRELEDLHHSICSRMRILLNRRNPCMWKHCKETWKMTCFRMREGGDGCCTGCEHRTLTGGCVTENILCMSWFCPELREAHPKKVEAVEKELYAIAAEWPGAHHPRWGAEKAILRCAVGGGVKDVKEALYTYSRGYDHLKPKEATDGES